MKLDSFNWTLDEYIAGITTVWGDVWKEDLNGIPHSMRDMYGNKLLVKVPSEISSKYKGRKLSSLIIWCNSCELVTGVEAHYGRPGAGGYALAYDRDFTSRDVTDHYKR